MFVNFETNNELVLMDYLSSEGFYGDAYKGQGPDMGAGGGTDMMDEELQMVLRISLEQEKKRIEEEEKKKLLIEEQQKNNKIEEEENPNQLKVKFLTCRKMIMIQKMTNSWKKQRN